jgi:RHS repeat-associated protein
VSNDSYAWTGDVAGTVNSTVNGRNQLIELDGATPQYDARGNMIRNDAFSFGFSSENLMTEIGAPGGALAPIPYDPLGRLAGDGNTSFLMDPAGGDAIVGEYWSTGFIRYIPGPGVDEPVVSIRSNGLRSDFYADERGSVIAVAEGASVWPQTYDEFGRTRNQYYYRFGYTGQARLTRDLYHYKARIYWGAGGRFLQPDPIGYGDGMNLYAYVGGDPVNGRDPTGMAMIPCAADTRIPACADGRPDDAPSPNVGLTGLGIGLVAGEGGGSRRQPRYPDNERGLARNAGLVNLPAICEGMSYDGTTLRVSPRVEFRSGEYIPYTDRGPADESHVEYYTHLARTSVYTNGTIGSYRLETELRRGEGGFKFYIQRPDVSGEWGSANAIWMPTPTGLAAEERWLGHALGHALGNPHPPTREGHLMDANPVGNPSNRLRPEHIERGLELCQLVR